eukprot:8957626-Pyramimonas_sp.AAC.1
MASRPGRGGRRAHFSHSRRTPASLASGRMVDGASSRTSIRTPRSVFQTALLTVAQPSSRSASTVAPAGPDTCRHGWGER